ncbi:hypothetical protein M2387_001780 [Klebsiella sp. BIGb0407]|nr:hypothetical protein [Klebsiella sp. BIGb0407]
MTISTKNVRFDDATVWVEFSEGRVIACLRTSTISAVAGIIVTD